MSVATQITYTFKDGTGSKPTTVAPVTNSKDQQKKLQQQCQQHRHQQQ
ncbi:MAG: hypothetical protein ACLUR5_10870 [Eubacterium ventriosum]